MLTYLHPLTGAAVLALLAYVGSLGLQARTNRRRAASLLARHQRWAFPIYWLVVISAVVGLATTWLLRPDLELAQSNHFKVGMALVVAMTLSRATASAMRRPLVRAAHPWFGIAALLLAAAQLFFGLQITP